MRFRIFSTAIEQIAAHVARDHPREACGLLVGADGGVDRAVASPNVASDPYDAFEIDPRLLLRCHREARAGGAAIIGWYHSHPNGGGLPSAADAARAVEPGKLWLIATKAELRAFISVPGGPIEGRFDAADLIILPPDTRE